GFEVVFVNDGSSDESWKLIARLAAERPNVRGIDLMRNYGQHNALLAGVRSARNQVVVTLDADLQNPPEEIPKLLAKLDEGYDVVGGMRQHRQDTFFRKFASRIVNKVTRMITGMKLNDYGCMLRGYSRDVVDQINLCEENST